MQIPDSISYRYLLQKAWPIILANASVPLLGLVDTAVIGNVGSITDLGAIAFGALIFSFVYWSFGFLRMGTTGFAAQASGAGDQQEVRAVLGRALLIALCLGVVLILIQWPIGLAAFSLLDGSTPVEAVAQEYFDIRIWGAPATLATFALMGLLIGLGKSRTLLIVQLFLNGLNILLDVWFAGILGWGASGIALGTVIAEWTTVLLAGWLVYRTLNERKLLTEVFWPKAKIMDLSALLKTASANLDIMLRTLILVFSFAFFINQSAKFGDTALASNHILLQLIAFSAFFLDGYAFVVEALVGGAIGAKRNDVFDLAVRRSTVLALTTAILLALVIALVGDIAVMLMTDISSVRLAANQLLPFAALYVLFSFAAFQLDGIFIGASFTRQIRDAAALSIAVYFIAWWALSDQYGIQGLWGAMIIYVVARAVALLLFYPSLRRSVRG
ncbi:MAG: MATE family efflux transporter [Porticoccaceae bacterium]|jgi:MATE family multidrug resistance protein|nr:MATE family efflux transporter [Porticoccaceae bacterium]